MKKILQYLLIGAIGVLFVRMTVQELFDNRPFKFEQYRTDDMLEKAAIKHFAIGSTVDEILKLLEKSGATCHKFNVSDKTKNYQSIASCDYNTPLFSLHPFEYYGISLCEDKKGELVQLETQRISGWAYLM